MWCSLAQNYEGTVNPSSSEFAGSSPAAPISAVISRSSNRFSDLSPVASELREPSIKSRFRECLITTPLFFY